MRKKTLILGTTQHDITFSPPPLRGRVREGGPKETLRNGYNPPPDPLRGSTSPFKLALGHAQAWPGWGQVFLEAPHRVREKIARTDD